jgi:quercetin dioxygenase-like cupin family protein
MDNPGQERRSFLLSVGGFSLSQMLPKTAALAQAATPQAYVLRAMEGEHLVHFRDHGSIYVKAGAATGSNNLALGSQQVTRAAGIPVHRHFEMDEAFYVLEGSGSVSLNDVTHTFEKGASIFIPKNTWHGFNNPENELLLLWTVTPAGLDGFFRETCSPPGVPPKQFTPDELHQIALKYGTEFR